MGARWRTGVAALALASTSCSFALVKGPRHVDEGLPPPCTTSYVLPALDGVLAVAAGVLAYVIIDKSDGEDSGVPGAIVAGGVSATGLVSGIYGAIQVSRCHVLDRGTPVMPDLVKDLHD
ncbi:MAG: hypothetical protein IT370_28120 [Deltaproteobacteria bacterium]|nr:hypothetical protein [Deltaproteobacteria bacterium]